jgi:hypothetical protein
MYDAAVNAAREIVELKGATHYFEGQPDVLDTALDALVGWVERRASADVRQSAVS